jgi:hypothetical protein
MKPEDLPAEPWQDPIVAEVRKVREALLAEVGFDLEAFCRRLQERQQDSGHPLVRKPTGNADRAA